MSMKEKIIAIMFALFMAASSIAFALPTKYHPAEQVINGTLPDNYTVNGTFTFNSNSTFGISSLFNSVLNMFGIRTLTPFYNFHVLGNVSLNDTFIINNGYTRILSNLSVDENITAKTIVANGSLLTDIRSDAIQSLNANKLTNIAFLNNAILLTATNVSGLNNALTLNASNITSGIFSGNYTFNSVLGINAINPNSTLHVVGTGASGGFRVTNQSNGAEVFFVNSTTGQVGIGTTNPDSRLAISGNLSVTTGAVLATSSGNVGIGTAAPAAKLQIGANTNTMPAGTNLFIVGGDGVFRIGAGDGDPRYGLYISGTYDAGTDKSVMTIGNRDASTDTGIITLRNGRVGIGTTAPDSKLAVSGNLSVTTGAVLATSSGSVGIGTISPLSKLHVSGNATFNATNQNIVELYNGTTNIANNKVIYFNSTGSQCFGAACGGSITYNGTTLVIKVV